MQLALAPSVCLPEVGDDEDEEEEDEEEEGGVRETAATRQVYMD